jgi:hypothetical protein
VDLDSAVESLSVAVRDAAAPSIHGWIRSRYASSGDVDTDAGSAGDQDLGGFDLDVARLVLGGEVGSDHSYTIALEAGDPLTADASTSGGQVGLLDAYAVVRVGESVTATVGRFSSTFLWRTSTEERKLLFLDRSFLGEAWDGRDVGVEFAGAFQRLNWWAAAQNGADGVENDLALSACACYQLLGEGLYTEEGTYGLGDAQHLSVSLAVFDDQSLDEGSAVGAGVFYARERWYAEVDVNDFADDLRPTPMINPATGTLVPSSASAAGAETPWGGTVAWMIDPGRWELALRLQDIDDAADTSSASVGASYYVAGHDAKWTLQLERSDSDDAALEADVLAIGLTVGF